MPRAVSRLRRLSMANSMEDLVKLAHVPEQRDKSLAYMIISAQITYSRAERFNLDGDKELSYICFKDFFNLVTFIKNMPDYAKQTKYLFDDESLEAIKIRAERVRRNLKRQYQALGGRTIWQVALVTRRSRRPVLPQKIYFRLRSNTTKQHQIKLIRDYLRGH